MRDVHVLRKEFMRDVRGTCAGCVLFEGASHGVSKRRGLVEVSGPGLTSNANSVINKLPLVNPSCTFKLSLFE